MQSLPKQTYLKSMQENLLNKNLIQKKKYSYCSLFTEPDIQQNKAQEHSTNRKRYFNRIESRNNISSQKNYESSQETLTLDLKQIPTTQISIKRDQVLRNSKQKSTFGRPHFSDPRFFKEFLAENRGKHSPGICSYEIK